MSIWYNRDVKKTKLASLTKLEGERQSKIETGELLEELDATGQENPIKAAKWVMEKQEREDKEEKERQAVTETKLHDAKGKTFTYQQALVEEFQRQLREFSIPNGFYWNVY